MSRGFKHDSNEMKFATHKSLSVLAVNAVCALMAFWCLAGGSIIETQPHDEVDGVVWWYSVINGEATVEYGKWKRHGNAILYARW